MSSWSEIQSIIEGQLNPYGYTGHLLSHFDFKKVHLENLIKRTAFMSESNSVLIIGPSGSGKTALLECVLEKIFKDPAINENMLHVNLNGLIHVDDDIALEDITQQLKLTEVEDKQLGSFPEKLQLLLADLKSRSETIKSVLFVLTNLELFVTRKNQTILNNLFDIANSQHTPICIVGLCRQPDVVQAFENQINSGFCLHEMHLLADISFKDYLDSAKHFLSVHSLKDNLFQNKWNSEIANLLKNSEVQNILECYFNFRRTLRDLKDLLYLALQNVKSSQPRLVIEDIAAAYMKLKCEENPKSNIILGLSVLEVGLLIAMIHHTEMCGGKAFTFEIVYNVLCKIFQNILKLNIPVSVARKSFEHLMWLEFIKPIDEYTTYNSQNYLFVKLMVNPIKIREIVMNYPNLPGELKNWIGSSLNTSTY